MAEQGDIGQRVRTSDGAEGRLGFKKDICWHGDNISLRRRTFYSTEHQLAPQKDIRHRRSSFDNAAAHFTAQKDDLLHRRSFDCAEGHLTSQNVKNSPGRHTAAQNDSWRRWITFDTQNAIWQGQKDIRDTQKDI